MKLKKTNSSGMALGFVLCFFLALAFVIQSAEAQISIMPLGDSITAGGGEATANNQSGYRDELYADLTNEGVAFNFVGSAATGLNVYSSPQLLAAGQAHNNGFGSYQLGDMYTNLAGTFPGGAGQPSQGGSTNMGGYWLTGTTNANFTDQGSTVSRPASYPNVVLLLGGVNDIYFGGSSTTSYLHAETNVSSILSWFKTNRPSTKVFVGSVFYMTTGDITGNNPSVVSNWNTEIAAYNSWIKTNVPSLGTNYYFVDTAAGFVTNGVANANICYDGIHPDANGYIVLGDEWNQALLSNNIIFPTITNNVTGIKNYSFEANVVAAGAYSILTPASWTVANLGNAVTAVVSPGSSDNRGWSSSPVVGLDGNNYCQFFATAAGGTATLSQDTKIPFQAGYTYKLVAAFGREQTAFATGSSFGLYNSSLAPIATRTITTNDLTLGQFNDVTLNYNGTGAEGGNGDIIILFNMPSTAGVSCFDFDDVALVATAPSPALISTQPISQTVTKGTNVSFTIIAGGTAPLSYQWYSNTNTLLAGATNASLSLTNVQSSATYDAVVTNAYGSATSSIAKLAVLPLPPASLTATPGVNSVSLAFAAVANAKFYTIYRSKVSGGPDTKIATTTALSYKDLNVVAGTTYYYVVNSCDGFNLSAYSIQKSATPHR